jgi:hypothetical protein
MDEELKTYLSGMEQRIASELQKLEERTALLIAAEVGGLHTEIQGVEKRLSARFESIDARLKLQAGLIQSGARAMARFSEFSENSEARWIALLSRVEALERKLSGGGHGNGKGTSH